jgi:hypothetical protein
VVYPSRDRFAVLPAVKSDEVGIEPTFMGATHASKLSFFITTHGDSRVCGHGKSTTPL